MNNILLIAHAPLASALRSAALHVFPEAGAYIAALDVLADQPPAQTLAAAQAVLALIHQDKAVTGTLVMSDVLGATPCNVAKQLVNDVHIRCVTGTSLPMLLRAMTYANEPLVSMAERALAGASQGAVAVN